MYSNYDATEKKGSLTGYALVQSPDFNGADKSQGLSDCSGGAILHSISCSCDTMR